jgi:hypothetical protein
MCDKILLREKARGGYAEEFLFSILRSLSLFDGEFALL